MQSIEVFSHTVCLQYSTQFRSLTLLETQLRGKIFIRVTESLILINLETYFALCKKQVTCFQKATSPKMYLYLACFIEFYIIIVSLILAEALEITQEHILDMIVQRILLNINEI